MNLFSELKKVRESGNGTVTYNFENGSRQISNINQSIFFTSRGKNENLVNVMNIFISTCHDLKAVSFSF